MGQVNVIGSLVLPIQSIPLEDTKVIYVARDNEGETPLNAKGVYHISSEGNYDFELEVGKFDTYITMYGKTHYVGLTLVTEDTPSESTLANLIQQIDT